MFDPKVFTLEGQIALVTGAGAGIGKSIAEVFAGAGEPKRFDMPMDAFRWAYELNVFAPFRLTQLAVPHMESAGGGAVLNISSMSAENRNKHMASYGSSKAAVSHLTRSIAFDLGPKNIRVNGIAPGATGPAARPRDRCVCWGLHLVDD